MNSTATFIENSHKIYEEFLYPNKLRKLAGPTAIKKSTQTESEDFSFLVLAGSMASGKLFDDHFLLRFNEMRKLKRNYHINEISSIKSNFTNFSLTINFDTTHSIRSSISTTLDNYMGSKTVESRTYFFPDLVSCQTFSAELQKSIISCNRDKQVKTEISGDALPVAYQNELQQTRQNLIERGERLREVVQNSERLRENARIFNQNARQLKESFKSRLF